MQTTARCEPNVQIACDPESLARQVVQLFVSVALDAASLVIGGQHLTYYSGMISFVPGWSLLGSLTTALLASTIFGHLFGVP